MPHYDANPANLEDVILDWEDFAEELVGGMLETSGHVVLSHTVWLRS